MDYCIPRYRFHLLGGANQTAEVLTPAEEAIRTSLQSLRGNTLWHHTIRYALDKKSVPELRKLMDIIISQARDNRPIMEEIIGADTLKNIEQARTV